MSIDNTYIGPFKTYKAAALDTGIIPTQYVFSFLRLSRGKKTWHLFHLLGGAGSPPCLRYGYPGFQVDRVKGSGFRD